MTCRMSGLRRRLGNTGMLIRPVPKNRGLAVTFVRRRNVTLRLVCFRGWLLGWVVWRWVYVDLWVVLVVSRGDC